MNQISSLFFLLPVVGCGPQHKEKVCMDLLKIPHTMTVHSRAFENGGKIPLANSSYGENITPDLAWSGVPTGTKSFVVIVEDPDAPGGTFTHWLLYGIQPGLRFLQSGVPSNRGMVPAGAQGDNDTGGLGYFGPRPPDNLPHHYHFQVIALKSMLRPRPGFDRSKLYAAIHDYFIAGGDLVGVFKKPN
jgi:Raf kinase inhibitor-like YbhB/YbcL family protein